MESQLTPATEFESGDVYDWHNSGGLFIQDICQDELEMKIMNLEPHQPTGSFPKDSLTKSSFSSDYHVKQKHDLSYVGFDFVTQQF